MPPEHKPEVERELVEIRKEVIESRNLVIKTDNLLKNLHAELKMVGKRQEDFQKRQWVSSGVAYGLFAALAIAGAVLLISARGAANSSERARLEKSVKDLTEQQEKAKADANAHLTAARSAAEVYRLMTTLPGDERLKGIDALVKLDQTRLSALEKQALNDRAELLRKEIGQAAFERGKSAFRRNEMPAVVSELSRFLAMNPAEQDSLDASFFLGTALNQLRKYDQAIPHLSRFVNGDKRSRTRDYGMLLLAHSYEQTGQLEKALETAREAAATYPNSEFAPQLRARISMAKRLMGAASGEPQVAAASGAAPAAQAAQPAGGAVAGQAAKPAVTPATAPAGKPAH